MSDRGPGEFAPAKVNLCLHVTGQRADGYHTLDSIVVFARDLGDRVCARAAAQTSLTIDGPMAQGLTAGPDNLMLRAAGLMPVQAALHLEKLLPVAAGIGGGSADAAATLRAIARLEGGKMPEATALLDLGADVPACVSGVPLRMEGIGERITPLKDFPDLPAVLINPGVPTPTGAVFDGLEAKSNTALSGSVPQGNAATVIDWLKAQRNDLEPPARALVPQISDALGALQSSALLARMSGSGATCFGLYATRSDAENAAAALQQTFPKAWVKACTFAGSDHPGDHVI